MRNINKLGREGKRKGGEKVAAGRGKEEEGTERKSQSKSECNAVNN